MENQITEIKAYKVNNLLFESIVDAERYIYEKLSPVNIGDFVSLDGGFKSVLGIFGLEGKVFDIVGDQIWFVSGLPKKYEIFSKDIIKRGGIYTDGKLTKWKVMARHRKELSKKSLPYINEFI